MTSTALNAPACDEPLSARETWLAAQRHAWQTRRAQRLQVETQLSWARLALFVAAVATLVIFLNQSPLWALAAGVLLLLAFALCVRRHAAAQAAREADDRLVKAAEQSAERLGGRVVCLRSGALPADDEKLAPPLPRALDDGPTWPLTAQERDDLDLFAAPCGLFGLLNRTATHRGAQRLRDTLLCPMLDPQRIHIRRQSVRWLADNPEPRLRMLSACNALLGEDRRCGKFTTAVQTCPALRVFAPVTLLRLWGLVSGLLVALGIGAAVAGYFTIASPMLGVLTLNLAVYLALRGPISDVLDPWIDTGWAARGFLVAARQASDDLPNEGELGILKAKLSAAVAPDAAPLLTARSGWAEGGGFMQLLANCAYLHELHVAARLEQPLIAARERILAAMSALADLEALLCLGAYAWEQPQVCWPTPTTDTQVDITNGRHPLIDPQRVIANSIALDAARPMWIVTGSNMAGKSTLLRMTGLSVLLAQCGSAVTAEDMRWRPLRLLTDLRARDDLSAGESYFLAEVRHLRRLVNPPAGPAPVLGLIDEPFRGTNSQDQSAASVAVARYLLRSDNLFVIATHDRHLTELADGQRVRNYHFRENLGRDGMVFDYRLHDGPAVTRNALRVLEAEGYPPELMAEAHAWLERTAEGDVYAAEA